MALKHLLLALPLVALASAPVSALLYQPQRFAALGAYTQPFEATSLWGVHDPLADPLRFHGDCYRGICNSHTGFVGR